MSGQDKSGPQPVQVCVFCGARSGSRLTYEDAACQVGQMLGRTGFGLVYGGGKTGLMGRVADAALQAGGHVLGVIPDHLTAAEIAHAGLSELIVVKTMHERKAIMASRSHAFLALPGGVGTFEEFFEILTWWVLGLHRKPIALLNVDGYFNALIAMLDLAVAEDFFGAEHRDSIRIFDEVSEVESWLLREVRARPEALADLMEWT